MQEFIGKKFGKWTVLSYLGKNKNRAHQFEVKCECGNESISDKIALVKGKSTQCKSCARKISCGGENNPSYKHGYSSPNHPQFHMHYIWCSIKQRCNNPKVKNFHRYGGRGIKICPQWENNFEQFVIDMGEIPKGYSIDRIDNNQGYFPENCRWVNKEDNCNNTSLNVHYEFNGEKLSETQWSRKLGISRNKMMWWTRKLGIQWVIENIESLKKTRVGMSDEEYIQLGLHLPKKRDRH